MDQNILIKHLINNVTLRLNILDRDAFEKAHLIKIVLTIQYVKFY